jgi:hypothetical protein
MVTGLCQFQLVHYINTNGHDGAVSLTPDGQTLTIYKDANGGDLYYSNFDGKEWSMPVPVWFKH